MITLYQFPPGFGLPNASPFCMKVETFLRMTGLPYRLDNRGQLLKAPKGKLPFIDDGGERIGDSQAILAHLTSKYRVDPDAALDARQRALGTTVSRLLEDHLYWTVLYTRWFCEPGWALTREVFFGAMPAPLRQIVPLVARRNMRRQLWGHGIGRHARAEIMELGCQDVRALAALLGDQPFLLGETPASIDAGAFAFLANLIWVPVDSEIKREALAAPALAGYCERMRARYFPEFATDAG